jgi:hypothetical protein
MESAERGLCNENAIHISEGRFCVASWLLPKGLGKSGHSQQMLQETGGALRQTDAMELELGSRGRAKIVGWGGGLAAKFYSYNTCWICHPHLAAAHWPA